MRWSLVALVLVGCGDSGELAALKLSLANAQESIVDTQSKQIDKTDEAIGILKSNTTALAAIKANIEALQVVSNPNGKESDPASAAQSPPAKANDTQTPLKVATPGDFSQETLVELATRLYARGVNTHMKTEDQLKAIDAQMQGVKSEPVQYQSRPTYSQPSGTVCINGQCFTPQRVSRKPRR